MLQKVAKCVAVVSLFLATTTHALPIVQADAFSAGDNKAALETSTGLVWMDFGVNSHLSYDNVRYLLPTEFAGWRLPTATEVDHLWTSLFGSLSEWNRYSQGFGTLASLSQDTYFNSIFDIFGQSPDATFSTYDADGNLLDTWSARSLFGVFMGDPGVSGLVSMSSPYDEVHDSSAMYLEMPDTDISGWFGTLLVKDTATVSEPGSIGLVLLAFFTLVARSRRLI